MLIFAPSPLLCLNLWCTCILFHPVYCPCSVTTAKSPLVSQSVVLCILFHPVSCPCSVTTAENSVSVSTSGSNSTAAMNSHLDHLVGASLEGLHMDDFEVTDLEREINNHAAGRSGQRKYCNVLCLGWPLPNNSFTVGCRLSERQLSGLSIQWFTSVCHVQKVIMACEQWNQHGHRHHTEFNGRGWVFPDSPHPEHHCNRCTRCIATGWGQMLSPRCLSL